MVWGAGVVLGWAASCPTFGQHIWQFLSVRRRLGQDGQFGRFPAIFLGPVSRWVQWLPVPRDVREGLVGGQSTQEVPPWQTCKERKKTPKEKLDLKIGASEIRESLGGSIHLGGEGVWVEPPHHGSCIKKERCADVVPNKNPIKWPKK